MVQQLLKALSPRLIRTVGAGRGWGMRGDEGGWGGSQRELIYGTGEPGGDKGGPGPPVPSGAFRSQLIGSAIDRIFSSLRST